MADPFDSRLSTSDFISQPSGLTLQDSAFAPALVFHFDAASHGVLDIVLMPKVSEFFGIEIVFNYRGEHNPPHFHARHAGKEGVFSINPLSYMHGDLSPRAVTLVIEWAVGHSGELTNCWRLAREMKPVPQIPPLE